MNLSDIKVSEWKDLMKQVDYTANTIARWYGVPKWAVYEYAKDCSIYLASNYRENTTVDLTSYMRAYLTHKTVQMVKQAMLKGFVSIDSDIDPQTGEVRELVCPELTVQSDADRMEKRDIVKRAMYNATKTEQAIMLGIMAGKTYAEIGREIGKTEQATKKAAERCLDRLRKIL